MTNLQQIITIAICAISTMLTRFLPFLIFSEKRKSPKYILYIGKYLPGSVFGMLIIYCLKDISILQGSHGIPEFIAIAFTTIVHLWKRQTLLSIAGGTIFYMLLIHFIFI